MYCHCVLSVCTVSVYCPVLSCPVLVSLLSTEIKWNYAIQTELSHCLLSDASPVYSLYIRTNPNKHIQQTSHFTPSHSVRMYGVEHSGLRTPYILSDMELIGTDMLSCEDAVGRMLHWDIPNLSLPKNKTLCGYHKNCSNVSPNSEVLAISKCHCLTSESRVIWSSEFVVIFKAGILFAPHINKWQHCVPRNCCVACQYLYSTVLCCTVLHCSVLYSTVLNCTALYCAVLHCNVLYCTALYCTSLQCTLLYCMYYTVLHCTVLYCAVLYCIVLYCTALHCILLYCIVLYCTILYCTVLYCTALHCTVLYCAVLYCIVMCCAVLYCTVLYCTVQYCTVLYYTVLHCTVLYCTVLHCTVLYCTVLCCVVL